MALSTSLRKWERELSNQFDLLLQQLPKGAVSFFAYFARFEYALKRGGFLKGDEGKGAEPAWDCFADRMGSSFFYEVKSKHIADDLLTKPPKKEIVLNGQPDWRCVPVDNARTLFDAVRRARNNLFHGGKSSPHEDTIRNEQLLLQALEVLKLALRECPKIRERFEEGLP